MPTEDTLRDQIATHLEREIPQIRMHGGSADIEQVDADAGTATIRLGGTCSDCGLSPMTTAALQSRLCRAIPELTEVRVRGI